MDGWTIPYNPTILTGLFRHNQVLICLVNQYESLVIPGIFLELSSVILNHYWVQGNVWSIIILAEMLLVLHVLDISKYYFLKWVTPRADTRIFQTLGLGKSAHSSALVWISPTLQNYHPA